MIVTILPIRQRGGRLHVGSFSDEQPIFSSILARDLGAVRTLLAGCPGATDRAMETGWRGLARLLGCRA